jgi:hypothetical protein
MRRVFLYPSLKGEPAMIHHSILFLAPEASVSRANTTSPPAVQTSASRLPDVWKKIRFLAGVVANAAGFGMLLAGCWFSLQLMQVVML